VPEDARSRDLRHQDRRATERRVSERRTHQLAATNCPRCGSQYIGRSSTRVWERPFRWLTGLVPFRCRTCRWRGWRRPEWLKLKPGGALPQVDEDSQTRIPADEFFDDDADFAEAL